MPISKFTTQFLFGFICLIIPFSTFAFDSLSGGGDITVTASNNNSGNKINLGEVTINDSTTGTAENVVITIPAGIATLNFDTSQLNFVVESGTAVISAISSTPTQINFTITGTGIIKIQGIGIFGTDFNTIGEIFELRTLSFSSNGGLGVLGNNFVVDSTDYAARGTFTGSSGGTIGDIFNIGNTLTYGFGVNQATYTARTDSITMDVVGFGGSATQPIGGFLVISGDDDNDNFSSPITLNYSNTNATLTYNSTTYRLDNQPPTFEGIDLNNFNFLTLPNNKTIAGIGDNLVLNIPTQSITDSLFFSVDFTDIAGTITNFQNQPAIAQNILLQEVNIDTTNYSKPITFLDDAGNTLSGTNTNSISLDLIKPIIANSNLLTLNLDNNVNGTGDIGDQILITAPTDSVTISDPITYSIDMSSIGGASTNFIGISGNQIIPVRSGILNSPFNTTFTLIDKGGNTDTSTTSPFININNQSPLAFNSMTGGGNKLVDITNNSLATRVKLETLNFQIDDAVDKEPVVISIDNTTGSPAAQLAFETTNMNISGSNPNANQNFVIENLIITPLEIKFNITGNGTFKIEELGIYGFNFDTVGEIFEKRNLNVRFRNIDTPADDFIVDTTNYTNKIQFNGATGGDIGDIFKINDILTFDFLPSNFDSRASFEIDLSGLGGPVSMLKSSSFTIIEDDDDRDNFNVFLTIKYTGVNVVNKIATSTFKVDNEPPIFTETLNTFDFLVIPEGKIAAGIGDTIHLKMPTETTSDTIFFSANFTDISGTIGNFQKVAIADQVLVLNNQLDFDENNYTKNIVFTDDAGNTLPAVATKSIIVDLIPPSLTANGGRTLSLFFFPDNTDNVGVIGEELGIELPTDGNETGNGNDTYFVSFDLSSVVGSAGVFDKFEHITPDLFGSPPRIIAGSLNNVNFSVPFTLFDKALNSVSGTSTSVLIDNKPPNFDTSCGGTFTVNDIGDSNGIADINNGGRDTITFNYPDKTSFGCDLNTFSIDFSPITGNSSDQLFNQDSNARSIVLNLADGNIDQNDFTLPFTISDTFGNVGQYSTGPVNIDNQIITQDLLEDFSDATVFFTPDQEIGVSAPINSKVRLFHEDIVSVFAQIPNGTTGVNLVNTIAHAWEGIDRVVSGPFIRDWEKFIFTVTDDAGNHITLNGIKNFFLTNDNREKGGGGGGSLSLSRLNKKTSFQRFTPRQTPQFHNKTWKEQIKSKEQRRLNSLKRRLMFGNLNSSRINYLKPKEKVDRERKFWRSRIIAMGRDKTPKHLQNNFEKVAFINIRKKTLDENRVKTSEYRVQSTLDNLKAHFSANKRSYFSGRKTGIGKSGTYSRIKKKKNIFSILGK